MTNLQKELTTVSDGDVRSGPTVCLAGVLCMATSRLSHGQVVKPRTAEQEWGCGVSLVGNLEGLLSWQFHRKG